MSFNVSGFSSARPQRATQYDRFMPRFDRVAFEMPPRDLNEGEYIHRLRYALTERNSPGRVQRFYSELAAEPEPYAHNPRRGVDIASLKKRVESIVASRVLDAPQITSDFYSHPLDCFDNNLVVALGSEVYSMKIFEDRAEFVCEEGGKLPTAVKWMDQNMRLLLGYDLGDVDIWDLKSSARKLRSVPCQRKVVTLCSSRQEPNSVLLGLENGSLVKLDVRIERAVVLLNRGAHRGQICGIAESGFHVITGGNDHEVKIWDMRFNAHSLATIPHLAAVKAITTCPSNNKLFATGADCPDKTIRLISLSDLKEKETIMTSAQVTGLFWRDEELISTHGIGTSNYQFIKVWHWSRNNSLTYLGSLAGHTATLHHAALDAETLVTAAADDTIHVWSLWKKPIEQPPPPVSPGNSRVGSSRTHIR